MKGVRVRIVEGFVLQSPTCENADLIAANTNGEAFTDEQLAADKAERERLEQDFIEACKRHNQTHEKLQTILDLLLSRAEEKFWEYDAKDEILKDLRAIVESLKNEQ